MDVRKDARNVKFHTSKEGRVKAPLHLCCTFGMNRMQVRYTVMVFRVSHSYLRRTFMGFQVSQEEGQLNLHQTFTRFSFRRQTFI